MISIYRAQIGGVEPFPERADDRDSVKQAWLEVCTSRSLRVELEEDIFKLVRQSPFFLSFFFVTIALLFVGRQSCFPGKRLCQNDIQALLYVCLQD